VALIARLSGDELAGARVALNLRESAQRRHCAPPEALPIIPERITIMRGAGYGLLVVGIIVAILGLVNHYVLKASAFNPIAHTSTILIGVGVVVAVIGLAMSFMGGRKSA